MHVDSAARESRPAPLLRRLAAIVYDSLLVLAIWMIGTLPLVMLAGVGLEPGNWLYSAYLALLAFAYFHFSWSGIGQTLGMRSWRLHLIREDSRRPMWQLSALRLGMALLSIACLGLGFVSALSRPDRSTWHDRVSGSRLEFRPGGSGSA